MELDVAVLAAEKFNKLCRLPGSTAHDLRREVPTDAATLIKDVISLYNALGPLERSLDGKSDAAYLLYGVDSRHNVIGCERKDYSDYRSWLADISPWGSVLPRFHPVVANGKNCVLVEIRINSGPAVHPHLPRLSRTDPGTLRDKGETIAACWPQVLAKFGRNTNSIPRNSFKEVLASSRRPYLILLADARCDLAPLEAVEWDTVISLGQGEAPFRKDEHARRFSDFAILRLGCLGQYSCSMDSRTAPLAIGSAALSLSRPLVVVSALKDPEIGANAIAFVRDFYFLAARAAHHALFFCSSADLRNVKLPGATRVIGQEQELANLIRLHCGAPLVSHVMLPSLHGSTFADTGVLVSFSELVILNAAESLHQGGDAPTPRISSEHSFHSGGELSLEALSKGDAGAGSCLVIRDLMGRLLRHCEDTLSRLRQSGDVEILAVCHHPASGATTAARWVAWKLCSRFLSILVRGIRPTTADSCQFLWGKSRLPLLLVLDLGDRQAAKAQELQTALRKKGVSALILTLHHRDPRNADLSDFPVFDITAELSPSEMKQFEALFGSYLAGHRPPSARRGPGAYAVAAVAAADSQQDAPFLWGLAAFLQDHQQLEARLRTLFRDLSREDARALVHAAVSWLFLQTPVSVNDLYLGVCTEKLSHPLSDLLQPCAADGPHAVRFPTSNQAAASQILLLAHQTAFDPSTCHQELAKLLARYLRPDELPGHLLDKLLRKEEGLGKFSGFVRFMEEHCPNGLVEAWRKHAATCIDSCSIRLTDGEQARRLHLPAHFALYLAHSALSSITHRAMPERKCLELSSEAEDVIRQVIGSSPNHPVLLALSGDILRLKSLVLAKAFITEPPAHDGDLGEVLECIKTSLGYYLRGSYFPGHTPNPRAFLGRAKCYISLLDHILRTVYRGQMEGFRAFLQDTQSEFIRAALERSYWVLGELLRLATDNATNATKDSIEKVKRNLLTVDPDGPLAGELLDGGDLHQIWLSQTRPSENGPLRQAFAKLQRTLYDKDFQTGLNYAKFFITCLLLAPSDSEAAGFTPPTHWCKVPPFFDAALSIALFLEKKDRRHVLFAMGALRDLSLSEPVPKALPEVRIVFQERLQTGALSRLRLQLGSGPDPRHADGIRFHGDRLAGSRLVIEELAPLTCSSPLSSLSRRVSFHLCLTADGLVALNIDDAGGSARQK